MKVPHLLCHLDRPCLQRPSTSACYKVAKTSPVTRLLDSVFPQAKIANSLHFSVCVICCLYLRPTQLNRTSDSPQCFETSQAQQRHKTSDCTDSLGSSLHAFHAHIVRGTSNLRSEKEQDCEHHVMVVMMRIASIRETSQALRTTIGRHNADVLVIRIRDTTGRTGVGRRPLDTRSR